MPVGYTSEINLLMRPLIKSLSESLQQGVILFMDYGFGEREYYHPDRNTGTLMCHTKHKTHDDYLSNLGQQDITAHVDFTEACESALAANLEIAGYTHQSAFLLYNNILQLAENKIKKNPSLTFKLSQQIQTLTQPHEMGELFKALALSKNFPYPLQGFELDLSHRL